MMKLDNVETKNTNLVCFTFENVTHKKVGQVVTHYQECMAGDKEALLPISISKLNTANDVDIIGL